MHKKSSMLINLTVSLIVSVAAIILPLHVSQSASSSARSTASSSSSPCPTNVLIQPGADYKYGAGETNVPMYTFDICFPPAHGIANVSWIGANVEANLSGTAGLSSLTGPGGNWLYRIMFYPPSYTGSNSVYGWYNGISGPHMNIPAGQWFTITIKGSTASSFVGYEEGRVCLTSLTYNSNKGSETINNANGNLPANVCRVLTVSN